MSETTNAFGPPTITALDGTVHTGKRLAFDETALLFDAFQDAIAADRQAPIIAVIERLCQAMDIPVRAVLDKAPGEALADASALFNCLYATPPRA